MHSAESVAALLSHCEITDSITCEILQNIGFNDNQHKMWESYGAMVFKSLRRDKFAEDIARLNLQNVIER